MALTVWQLPYGEVSPAVTRVLRRGQRELWWEIGAPILGRALLGASSVLLGAAICHLFVPLPLPLFWLASSLFLLRGAILAARQRPSLGTVACVLDRRLHLRERLATALEVAARGQHGPLASALLAEVSSMAEHLPIRSAFPRRWPRRELGAAAALLGAVAFLSFGSIVDPRVAGGSGEGLLARQIPDVRSLILPLAGSTAPASNAERAQSVSGLAVATNANQQHSPSLARPETREGRRSATTMAGNTAHRQESLRQLGRQWQSSTATAVLGRLLASGQYGATSEALQTLAAHADTIGSGERQQMAWSLAEAARLTADKELAAALRAAAQALSQSDSGLLAAALQDLARQIGAGGGPAVMQGGDDQQGLRERTAAAQEPNSSHSDDAGEAQVSAARGGGAAPGSMPDREGHAERRPVVPVIPGERKRPLRDFGDASAEEWVPTATAGELRPLRVAETENQEVPLPRLAGLGQLEEDTPAARATRGVASTADVSAGGSIKGRVQTRPEAAHVPWAARSYVRGYFGGRDNGQPGSGESKSNK